MHNYKIAGASVIGTFHDSAGYNNQDAYDHISTPGYIVAVVSDGCGSGRFSEVGSRICTQVLVHLVPALVIHARRVSWWVTEEDIPTWVMECCRQRLLELIRAGTVDITDDENVVKNLIYESYLFTVIGFYLSPNLSFAFHFGDGHIWIEGEHTALGPFPGNAPPYLAHQLDANHPDAGTCRQFSIVKLPRDVTSIAIATDGIDDFLAKEGHTLPGRNDVIIPNIQNIWEDATWYDHPAQLQRFLAKANPITRPSLRALGMLSDDTTVVVCKRFSGPLV